MQVKKEYNTDKGYSVKYVIRKDGKPDIQIVPTPKKPAKVK